MSLGEVYGWFFDIHIGWYAAIVAVCVLVLWVKVELMTDQCKNCDLRGDIEKCLAAECFHHENWMAIEQQKRIDKLEQALKIISEWHGQFPSTGKFWDDDPNRPVTYGAAYGSNGERDYMRALATKALSEDDL